MPAGFGACPRCCGCCGGDGEPAVTLLYKHGEMVHSPAASGGAGQRRVGKALASV